MTVTDFLLGCITADEDAMRAAWIAHGETPAERDYLAEQWPKSLNGAAARLRSEARRFGVAFLTVSPWLAKKWAVRYSERAGFDERWLS